MIYKENAPQSFAPVVNDSSTRLHRNNYHRGRVEQNLKPLSQGRETGEGRRMGSIFVSRKHSLWHLLDFPLFRRWPSTIAAVPKCSEVMETESLD